MTAINYDLEEWAVENVTVTNYVLEDWAVENMTNKL